MKRAICLIGILLLTALALAACGGVPADTTPVDTQPIFTQPVDTAPSLPSHTLPAETTSWQEYLADVMTPDQPDRYSPEDFIYRLTLTEDDRLVLTEGDAVLYSRDLRELEEYSSGFFDVMDSYYGGRDAARFITYLRNLWPERSIPLMEAYYPVVADGEDHENELSFSLDLNNNQWLYFRVMQDGRFWIQFWEEGGTRSPWLLSPSALSYEEILDMRPLFYDRAEAPDRCGEYPATEEYAYSLRPLEGGGLAFCYGEEILKVYSIHAFENGNVVGRGGYDSSYRSEIEVSFLSKDTRMGDLLAEVFSQEIKLRPHLGPITDGQRSSWIRGDYNDGESFFMYIYLSGKLYFFDAADHIFVSEPGYWEENEIISITEKYR